MRPAVSSLPRRCTSEGGSMALPPDAKQGAEQRMLGAVAGVPALGRGPAPKGGYSRHEYHHPAAGWGAARSVGRVLERAGEPLVGVRALFVMNHEAGGFDCPGCAWPDDPNGLRLDICENGVKHVTWELAPAKVDREFFAAHTVRELAGWSDYDLEAVGRLAEPMSYDPASDKYEPISWEDAFALVGGTLRELESPDQASFYTSGRLSNEATFLYQLWVRELGTNNLPDCSNMCHEASGRAMTAAIGSGKGTVDLHDWEAADAIWLMADNAGSNAPDAHLAGRGRPTRRAARPHQPADRGGLEANDRPARARRHGDLPHDRDRHDERAGADR